MTTTSQVHTTAWWRPRATPTEDPVQDARLAAHARRVAPTRANVIAFRALIAFTVILLLSPQAWFPVLGQLRIAFVAAIVAIGAFLMDRVVRRDGAAPVTAEIGIALMLVAWNALGEAFFIFL